MLTVHHLNQSRIATRTVGTGRAAAALSDSPLSARENDAGAGGAEKIHPLGKSPVLEDNGYVLAESGAILEYLQEHLGQRRVVEAAGN